MSFRSSSYPVTVSIPVFNGAKYLAEAIESIISQTFLPNEIIIVDNASTDNSKEIALTYNEKASEQINFKVISNEETIPYANNWNKCIQYAANPYVLLLHADDKLICNAIELLYKEFLERRDLAIVGSSGEIFINSNDSLIKDSSKNIDKLFLPGEVKNFFMFNGLYIPCSSVMMNRTFLLRDGLLFPENKPAADELLWIKIVSIHSIKILGPSLTYRRIHDSNTEYLDQLQAKQWIVSAQNDFLSLADYATTKSDKQFLYKGIKKKSGEAFLTIAGTMIKKYKKVRLSLWYLWKGVISHPIILTNRRFWKILIYNFITLFGLYDTIFNFKRRIT